jgi:hypothetical protein
VPGGRAAPLRHVHVNTLDLDGDGRPEIQVNQFVYDDFVAAPPFTRVPGVEIAPRSLFAYDGGYTGRFDRHTSAMVTGDLTADGRGDVALYSQATHKLEIWGIDEPARTWTRQGSIALAPLAGDAAVAPVLLAPNVNHDSLVLKYDGGEHRLVFTEPIVIAALAAAPCHGNLSQDRSYCRTAFGVAESSTVETEDTYTITTSSSVGFSAEFSVLGAKVAGLDVLATVQAHASRITSKAYTLTKRLVYTTGPIEDTVIFTTIPHDQYTSGGNLGRLVGAGGDVLLPVLVELAAALDCVHGARIVHRDLKPANVLLTPGVPPRPKLADFGIVKLFDDRATQLTETGAVLGTIDYLSPRGARGRGARSALGSVLPGVRHLLPLGRPAAVLRRAAQAHAGPPRSRGAPAARGRPGGARGARAPRGAAPRSRPREPPAARRRRGSRAPRHPPRHLPGPGPGPPRARAPRRHPARRAPRGRARAGPRGRRPRLAGARGAVARDAAAVRAVAPRGRRPGSGAGVPRAARGRARRDARARPRVGPGSPGSSARARGRPGRGGAARGAHRVHRAARGRARPRR